MAIYDLMLSPNNKENTKITMLATQYCHKFLTKSLENFNQARMKTLLQCGDALIKGNELTLTSIGRHLSGKAKVKNKIKRVDRFLKSKTLSDDELLVYKQLFVSLFGSLPSVVIGVDWSGCCSADFWLLRASLLVDGRSIPVYNKVVKKEDLETNESHDAFLDDLATILPKEKPVYIVTDGGFKTPWFHKVDSLGWFYIGRVRGRITGKIEDQEWKSVSQLSKGANTKPKSLGSGLLGKTSPTRVNCRFHLYKGKIKGRKKLKGRYPDTEKMYKSIAKEPWLLVSNDDDLTAKTAVIYYSKRMQIEQNFRDDKSLRYGFSWRHSKTQGVRRISALCLISHVATLVLWLMGYQAEKRKMHLQFQANTIKTRRVLSFLTLAKNIIVQHRMRTVMGLLKQAIRSLQHEYQKQILTPLT
ncbi:hypothetical protein C2869_18600 [Saccharobesus litoralis]|uniref:Transposase IS4-like domain-containing protein n=1 Tax=Saccharobesus litoralis TaxID=2172099 RepID=A0A2S0VNI7_9ALTE|nr:IS4 family transposase [Saccharobesus litoralis]AWB65791.1 hypothetical protein C2869_04765 [Saccharobesus litoralis]AWB68299.1 hypothetical protein C2869_18600 [Saccharobesus litoralis]